jgi:amidophosphoribosyltransferase
MSELGQFVAFQAAVALVKERGFDGLLDEVAEACRKSLADEKDVQTNQVKRVYENFTAEEISSKIAELLTPESSPWEVEIIFQTIESLHLALPNHKGDWYFTGDYPTPGGYRVVHKAFLNYYENKDGRSY